LFVVSASRKAQPVLPTTTRSTEWTSERIGRMSALEVRQLRDNALRLGEPEIAARCEEVLTRQRREATAARKALPPKPRKPKPAKVPAEE
jgi:hypothetical protein